MTWPIVVALFAIAVGAVLASLGVRLAHLSRMETTSHKLADRVVERLGWPLLVAIPTLAVLCAFGSLAYLAITDAREDGPTESTIDTPTRQTATASAVPTLAEPTMRRTVSITDEFDDDVIDREKWLEPSDESVIYESEGVLNFRVESDRSLLEGGVSAQVEGIPRGERVTEVAYTAQVISHEATAEDVASGVRLDLFLSDDQLLSVDVGANDEGPGSEFLLCPEESSPYGECTPKSGPTVAAGQPIDIRVVWTSSRIEFYFDGRLEEFYQLGAVDIIKLQLFMYADAGMGLHIGIDGFRVTYDDGA